MKVNPRGKVPTAAVRKQGHFRSRLIGSVSSATKTWGLMGILLFVAIVFRVLAPAYLSSGNILDILSEATLLTIISLGMAITIAGGGFDLSVGHIAGLAALVAAILSAAGVNTGLAVLCGVLTGGILGTFNGAIVSLLGISSFVATLGTQFIIVGIRYWISGGTSIILFSDSFKNIGDGKLFSIPTPIIIMAVVVIACIVFMEHTVFGRRVSAVGSNIEASRHSGINIRKYTALTFVLAGVLSSFTGIIVVARQGMANVGVGDGFLLDAMTIAVFSMVLFGKMKPFGVLLTTVLIVMLANGLTMISVSPSVINLVKGCMLLSAISLGGVFEVIDLRGGLRKPSEAAVENANVSN